MADDSTATAPDIQNEMQSAPPAGTPPPAAAPAAGTPPAVAAAPAAQPAAPPTVVTPQKRGGLAGIIDEFRDAIAGPAPGRVHVDAQGNKYIQHEDSTGNKWLRIAGTAIRGAAAGAAAGKGRGNLGAAAAAGVQAGSQIADRRQQQTKDQNEEVKQAQLEKFNAIKQKHDLVVQQFDLAQRKLKGTEEDVGWSQKQIDRERALGSVDLGVHSDPAKFADEMKKQHPEFWKDAYSSDNPLVPIDELAADGTHLGTHMFLRTPGLGNQLVDPDKAFIKVLVPGKTAQDRPTLEDQKVTVPLTMNAQDTYNNAAQLKLHKWDTDKALADEREAKGAADKEKADAAMLKAKSGKGKGAAAGGTAAANPAGLKGEDYLKTLPPDQAALVRDIGTGRVAPERISYLLGRGQGKNTQQIMAQVAAAYPDLDTSKLAAYPKTYQDFTSGKTATALNSGGTAMVHLHELQQLNTATSHIPHTSDWTAYQNKADTVASELAKFYGDATIPAIKSIKDTLTSTLPGNRDAAIRTQARSMGDKFDSYEQQWKNAAPSAAYQAKMPTVSQNAKSARAALDPEYGKRLRTEEPPRPAGVPANAQWNPQTETWQLKPQ